MKFNLRSPSLSLFHESLEVVERVDDLPVARVGGRKVCFGLRSEESHMKRRLL